MVATINVSFASRVQRNAAAGAGVGGGVVEWRNGVVVVGWWVDVAWRGAVSVYACGCVWGFVGVRVCVRGEL